MRILLLLALSLFITVPGIFSVPPYDRDESRFVQSSKQMVETGDYVDIRIQDEKRYKKPVGIYWLQAAAVNLSGYGAEAPIWVYRTVSVAGAVLAVIGVAWTGANLIGAAAGLVAGLAMAAMFGLAFEARMAKTDALLLATVVFAQGALAQLHAAHRAGRTAPRHVAWVFWIAQGVGLLVKGPITPLASLLTVAALWLFERDLSWLRTLRIGRGLPLTVLIVAPWLVAITWKSGGAFWQEAVGKDMFGKVASGQESHGAPPGYYVLTYMVYAWPLGYAALAAGLRAWNRARSEPVLMFLLCWYVPFWLFFEIMWTKLPHYVLPAYPALALMLGWLIAETGGSGHGAFRGWQVWLLRLALIGQVVVTAGLAAIAIGGPLYFGSGVTIAAIAAALAVAGAGWLGVPREDEWTSDRIAATTGAVGVAYALLFALVLPSMTAMWMSPRLAAAFEANRRCETSVLAAAGYSEPSLVFLAGTDTILTDLPGVAEHLLGDPACAVGVVPHNQLAGVAARLSEAGMAPETVATVSGINYTRGERLSLAVVRVKQ